MEEGAQCEVSAHSSLSATWKVTSILSWAAFDGRREGQREGPAAILQPFLLSGFIRAKETLMHLNNMPGGRERHKQKSVETAKMSIPILTFSSFLVELKGSGRGGKVRARP